MTRVTLTGRQGDTGPKGDTGSTGPKGDKGDTGAAATVAVGTVTTGAAGSSASVTNTGTSSAAVLAFTIPRGDKGDTGPAGTGAEPTIVRGPMFGPTQFAAAAGTSNPNPTSTIPDPYDAAHADRTYTRVWLPGAADQYRSVQSYGYGAAAGRSWSDVEVYHYDAITTDTVLCLQSGRQSKDAAFSIFYNSNSSDIRLDVSTATETGSTATSLNRWGLTGSPRRMVRVIYVRQDSVGGHQFIITPWPNGGQPKIDTAPYAVSRVELEWVDWQTGHTLVSPAATLPDAYAPSGPMWRPMVELDAALTYRGLFYGRDLDTAQLSDAVAQLKRVTSSAYTALGDLNVGPIGIHPAYESRMKHTFLPPWPWQDPELSGFIIGIPGELGYDGKTFNGAAWVFDPGGSIATQYPARVSTPDGGSGVIGSSTGMPTTSGPFTAFLGNQLHEICHPLDWAFGIPAFGKRAANSTYFTNLWTTYLQTGATGYGSAESGFYSATGTFYTGTRIPPDVYGAGNILESWAECLGAAFHFNATGDYFPLRLAFGAYVTNAAVGATPRQGYWVSRKVEDVIIDYLAWINTLGAGITRTYTPVSATVPPVYREPF